MDDEILIPALSEPPMWDEACKVHDWRNHVGRRTRSIWSTLTLDQKRLKEMGFKKIERGDCGYQCGMESFSLKLGPIKGKDLKRAGGRKSRTATHD